MPYFYCITSAGVQILVAILCFYLYLLNFYPCLDCSFFLSGKLFFKSKCPSVFQLSIEGNMIFSAAKQGIRLIFNSMSTQFIIYLVRRSVCLSCCNILIHIFFCTHFVQPQLLMDGIILVILGIFLLVLLMYYLKRHTEKYYIKCTANCQKERGKWAVYH